MLLLATNFGGNSPVGAQQIDFNRDIRPILSRHCIACHGPDKNQRKADLRLDEREESLAVIEPEDVESSELFSRITADDDERMPPPEHGNALNADEIELIKRWIEQGAVYARHWSFVTPAKPTPPVVEDKVRNPIDAFVSKKLSQVGLKPSADADPRRLIRRLALDLTGLPPDKALVDRFADSPTDETYVEVVNELLASSAYGEHWTGMWLDLARYADTIGYAEDKHRSIWPWRDWVVRAFNANMPYDQFTIEQIAGDLLPAATVDQRLATAFHRNTLNNSEGGTSDEEFRTIAVKDRISTTVNVWMGLTIRCAECHTHKYDPISQTEYYQFFDFFNQTLDADHNDERPRMDIYPAGRESEFARMDEQIESLKQKITNAESESETLKKLKQQLDQAVKQRHAPIRVPVMVERKPKQPRQTHIMTRGSYLQPNEKVSAAVFKSFHQLPEGTKKDRLAIAKWLVSDDNPLTARVTVNRFWAKLFGQGIVETEEDFGTQGTPPSNQELLDWLAVDFQENGWNVKRLLKQIVTSSTYRQSSVATRDQLAKDPHNMFLSRGPRFRMRAEVIRDQALAVSGLLSRKQFGPPVYPPNPVKKVRSAFTGGSVWNESKGEDRYRRAIYTYLKRTSPHPLFETFDMATREVCNMRRIRTNTPLQSFMTLNDRTFIEAAQAIAATMLKHDQSPREQIRYGYEKALLRDGTEQQITSLENLYARLVEKYKNNPKEAVELMDGVEEFGIDQETRKAKTSELASLIVVANVILNLDSFLTK